MKIQVKIFLFVFRFIGKKIAKPYCGLFWNQILGERKIQNNLNRTYLYFARSAWPHYFNCKGGFFGFFLLFSTCACLDSSGEAKWNMHRNVFSHLTALSRRQSANGQEKEIGKSLWCLSVLREQWQPHPISSYCLWRNR